MNTIRFIAATVLGSFLLLGACSSTPAKSADVQDSSLPPPPPGARWAKSGSGENVIVYDITDADKAALASKEPIKGEEAALVVNGLGCPQCASQVDVQLVRLPGVTRADVDLSTGVVTISMSGAKRPSPYQLREAVLDAGFTLVRVQELK
jgi:copper chaperone CopZ